LLIPFLAKRAKFVYDCSGDCEAALAGAIAFVVILDKGVFRLQRQLFDIPRWDLREPPFKLRDFVLRRGAAPLFFFPFENGVVFVLERL
jgi:hypothetical protein